MGEGRRHTSGLRYGSVCSGIEAATAAWHPLGWRPSFFSEIEAFPRAVLAHHYPDVPLHGDFTTIEAGQYEPIDLLVGGTPCQSFSVAGLRGGLDDERGNLALEYLRLADRLRPRWLVWENVPGVLSSNGGRDFGAILGGMVELGYGFAYRVLDAQFFGLAQRRKRVFVVGHLGDWRPAAAVLFERHSLSGHPAPRREAGEGTTPCLANGAHGSNGAGIGEEGDPAFTLDVATRVAVATPILDGAKGRTDKRGSRDGSALGDPGDPMFTLREGSSHAVAVHAIQAGALRENPDAGPDGVGVQTDHAYTLEARAEVQAVAYSIMPQNSGKDYKARPVDVAQPVMAGGPVGGNQGGDYVVQPVPIDMRQASRGEKLTNNRAHGSGGPPGHGVGEAGDPAFTVSERGQAVAFALRGREGGAMPEVGGDKVGALRSASGGSTRDYVAQSLKPMYGVSHANAPKTGPHQALRALLEASGEEAFAEWGLGVLAAFWPTEVLRSEVHGRRVRRAPLPQRGLVHLALSRSQAGSGWSMRDLWQAGCDGCPPSGWGPHEQLARQLGAYLSELPYSPSPAQRLLHDLWSASEGAGLLREALSAVQETRRSSCGEGQPAQSGSAVRRLTVEECEALQGFPRSYTLIPWRKGMAPDGPRYKALGNSMAVPCMAWIGQRIATVDAISAVEVAA